MKKILILILYISTNFIFSQEKSIEKFIYKPDYRHLDHIDSPKSIFVEESLFDKEGEKKYNSTNNYKVIYNNQNQIKKHLTFGKSIKKPIKITTYDTLNRIIKIEVNRENGNGEIIQQYFSRDIEFPDSLKIFSKKMVEHRKIINHFKDNIIRKRSLIENNTLRYYTLFKYDSKNQLIKVLNINTKNGFGITNKLGSTTTKRLNRNDSTLYNYKNNGDTLIVNSERFKGLIVTKKAFKDDNVTISIEEQTSTKSGLTFQRWTDYKWKDSTKSEHKYYKKNNILKSYYNSYKYQGKIISKWKDPITMKKGLPEKLGVTTIQTVFDNNGNWICKTFIEDNRKYKEIKRIIEY